MDEHVWELFAETKRLYSEPLIGASDKDLQKLLDYAGCALPENYLQMLRRFNGRGDEIETAEEVIQTNQLYDHVQKSMPGCLIIGGTGGPDFFGLDIRSQDPENMPVVIFPTMAIGWDTVTRVWKSFDDFLLAVLGADN